MSGRQTWKESVLECNGDAVNKEDAEIVIVGGLELWETVQ